MYIRRLTSVQFLKPSKQSGNFVWYFSHMKASQGENSSPDGSERRTVAKPGHGQNLSSTFYRPFRILVEKIDVIETTNCRLVN